MIEHGIDRWAAEAQSQRDLDQFNAGRKDAIQDVILWLESMAVDWEHITSAEQALNSAIETFRRWR